MTDLGHHPAWVIARQNMVDVRSNVFKADKENCALALK